MHQNFNYPTYLVRRKVLKLFGGAFHIYNPNGDVVFYGDMKAFKLREDIRVYTGEDKQTELLNITARKILDFSSAYDVVDSITKEKVGVLKRKGFKSLLKDEWIFMDKNDKDIGSIKEENMFLAIIRRTLIKLIPQKYTGEIGGVEVCKFKQNFNPFVTKITIDFSQDNGKLLDKRLGIAAAVLLCAIEGKQK